MGEWGKGDSIEARDRMMWKEQCWIIQETECVEGTRKVHFMGPGWGNERAEDEEQYVGWYTQYVCLLECM